MSNENVTKQAQATRTFGIGLPQEKGNFFIGDRDGPDGMKNIVLAHTVRLPGDIFNTYAGSATPLTARDGMIHYGPVPGPSRSLSAQARKAS